MKTYLKTKTVTINDSEVQISQLSGLARFDFLDYCSSKEHPNQPVNPGENATKEQVEQYELEMTRCYQKWQRLNFDCQARLVAYGMPTDEDLDTRHKNVMSTMTPELVKQFHDEIAVFSGMPLPDAESEQPSEEEPDLDVQSAEPVDPKV